MGSTVEIIVVSMDRVLSEGVLMVSTDGFTVLEATLSLS